MREYRYLSYEQEFDEDSSMWVITARDAHGDPFGVGTGERIEDAEERLRLWVLDSLLADAADGELRVRDLLREAPEGPAVSFTTVDFMPVFLRATRVRHHLTQAQLAERLGESQQAYAKLERPGANPRLRTIQQVESAMDEDLLQLSGIDEDQLQPA